VPATAGTRATLLRSRLLLTLAPSQDQILAKLPGKANGKFVWHQDMGYWPDPQDDANRPTTTATVSLALNDADVKNGCLVIVGKSGVAKRDSLRSHVPLMSKKDIAEKTEDAIKDEEGVAVAEGHALVVELDEADEVTFLPVAAGGITVHDEWILHGSGGNQDADRWRHTYVLAYRDPGMIGWERSLEPGG
jgi:ectoine hydroxylase-related dioxygenase (phytanoyl-CoA dioxygenase family)